MKVLLLLLLAIALICVGCSGSSYITQDTYLAHQGFLELLNGNYAMAEANLLVSLDIDPHNSYALLNLGAVYQDTGRTWQAVEMYEKVIELNPEQTAVESNNGKYKGKNLVEIAKKNLRSLAVIDVSKGNIDGPFDMRESIPKISHTKTIHTVSIDEMPSLSDTTAVFASKLYVEGKQESTYFALSEGPGDGGSGQSGDDGDSGGGSGGDGGGDGGSGGDGDSDGGSGGDGGGDGGSGGDGDSDGGSGGGGDSDGGSGGDGDSGGGSGGGDHGGG
ncbi:MAG: tetratricopeptide repeat protein, partial [Desulfobacterales bacterium]